MSSRRVTSALLKSTASLRFNAACPRYISQSWVNLRELSTESSTSGKSLRERIILNSSRPAAPQQQPVSVAKDAKQEDDDSLEKEKALYAVKRDMTQHYNRGEFEAALRKAVELHDMTVQLYGKKNAIFASCLNNIALMQKQLGNNESALDRYIAALQVYEEVSGKQSVSYASTLANLGALYKHMASTAKGLEKQQFLDRAEEAVKDAFDLRMKMHGPRHRDTVSANILLASVYMLRNRNADAIQSLRSSLRMAEEIVGPHDVLVALIENNLGFVYKNVGEYQSAQKSYERALLIRSTTMGDKHPETIVVMHNLAECLLAAGKGKEANALQQKILDLTADAVDANEAALQEASTAAAPAPETTPTKTEAPLSAALLPNEDNRVRPPTAAEIVKRSLEEDKLTQPRPPPVTFQHRPHTPATRKKSK